VKLKTNGDTIKIKINLKLSVADLSYFLIDKYLQKEMASFKKFIFDGAYEPVNINVGNAEKNIASVIYVLFFVLNVGLWYALSEIIIHRLPKISSPESYSLLTFGIFALVAPVLLFVLNQLFFMVRRGLLKIKIAFLS
jgi:hypothetical protein